jgi:hypothetical protein
MRTLGALRAGHAPTPTVVISNLQHSSGADTSRGERNSIAAPLERDRAGIQRFHRIESRRTKSERVRRLNHISRADTEGTWRDRPKRGREARRAGEYEASTRAHKPLDRIRLRLNERIDSDDGCNARRVELRENPLRDIDVWRNGEARDHRPPALLERRHDELPFPTGIADHNDRSRRSGIRRGDERTFLTQMCHDRTDHDGRDNTRAEPADFDTVDRTSTIAEDHRGILGRGDVDSNFTSRIR